MRRYLTLAAFLVAASLSLPAQTTLTGAVATYASGTVYTVDLQTGNQSPIVQMDGSGNFSLAVNSHPHTFYVIAPLGTGLVNFSVALPSYTGGGSTSITSILTANTPPITGGTIQLGGDIGGTRTVPRIIGIRGSPVSSTAPTSGQCLVWNGTQYAPATCGSGGGATIAVTTNVIKGDNTGNGVAATPGTDYMTPAEVAAAYCALAGCTLTGNLNAPHGYFGSPSTAAKAALAGQGLAVDCTSSAGTPAALVGYLRCDSTLGWLASALNGAETKLLTASNFAGNFPNVVSSTSNLGGYTLVTAMATSGKSVQPSLIATDINGKNLNIPGILDTCLDTSGSATTQVCSTYTGIALVAGSHIRYSTTTTNTGDLTVNVNGVGAVHVRKWLGSSVLASGDLPANMPVDLNYDGTYLEAQTIGNAPSGGGGNVYTDATNPTQALGPATTWQGDHGASPNTFWQPFTSTNSGASSGIPNGYGCMVGYNLVSGSNYAGRAFCGDGGPHQYFYVTVSAAPIASQSWLETMHGDYNAWTIDGQLTSSSFLFYSNGLFQGGITVHPSVRGTLTYTTATSDTATVTGASASSNCTFAPTNAAAAATTVLGYISNTTTNAVTITHAATVANGGTVNIVCSID